MTDSDQLVCVLNANLVDIDLSENLAAVTALQVSGYAGKRFRVRAKYYVLCHGGIENPRTLLNANRQMRQGIGNATDLVGRFFMEHPHFTTGFGIVDHSHPGLRRFLDSRCSELRAAIYEPTEALQRREEILSFGLRFAPQPGMCLPDDNTAFLRVVNTPRRDIGVTSRGAIAQVAGRRHLSLFEAALTAECRGSIMPRSAASLQTFCDLIVATGDAGERSDPIEAARDLVEHIGYEAWLRDQADKPEHAERRIENVRELITWLGRLHDEDPAQGLTELMGRLSLLTSLDTDKEPDQEVRLMTLHGSKGLEFPHVFMAGVEEDLLPHRNSLEEGGEASLFVLAAIVTHESLSIDDLATVTRSTVGRCHIHVDRLIDLGAARVDSGLIRITTTWQRAAIRLLRRRNLLPA